MRSFRLILIAGVLIAGVHLASWSAVAESGVSGARAAAGGVSFSWNSTSSEAPFLRLPNSASAALDAQLIYPSGDFTFPLAQSLYFDAKCDCYALTLSSNASRTLRVVNFWRAPVGFYRTANGPYLELENLDSLKALTDLHGRRFLFAQVGDGEWHCVSIHDSSGGYVLIDYRADGLIEQLRDSFSRHAIPNYYEGMITSLSQTWTNRSGQEMRNTLLTTAGRK
jgi:hypothetical protein